MFHASQSTEEINMPENEARKRSLIEGINRIRNNPRTFMGSGDPNFDPGQTQALQAQLASFESELSGIEEGKAQRDVERQLGFFEEALPAGATETQSDLVRDLFSTRRAEDIDALDQLFKEQRGSQLDEAAVAGNLRQPGFQASLAQGIDANKSRAVGDLLSRLSGQEAGQLLNVSQRGQDLGLQAAGAKAGIVGGESQFARNLGLDKDRFGFQRDFSTRQQGLDELFRNAQLAEQVRGRKQKGKRDLFDKVGAGLDLTQKTSDLVFGQGQKEQGIAGLFV